MKQKFVVIAAVVGLLALAGSAWAHHSLQSEYDIRIADRELRAKLSPRIRVFRPVAA